MHVVEQGFRPVQGRMLEETIGMVCMCVRTRFICWQPIGISQIESCLCIGHRNRAWSDSLLKSWAVNWWMRGLVQPQMCFIWPEHDFFFLNGYKVFSVGTTVAIVLAPPHCLARHLLYSLNFMPGLCGHLNQHFLGILKIIVFLINSFRHFFFCFSPSLSENLIAQIN